MSVISKMTFDNGSTKNLISSTFYGKCDTAAATAAKTVTIGDWDESVKDNVSGATVHIYFTNGNTATSPTLNIDGGGAHPLYVEDDVKATAFPAGIYSLTLVLFTISSQETWCWLMQAKTDWNYISNKPSLNFIPTSEKGASSGVAELDANGKVPSSQLPSYVDDVINGYYNPADELFYEERTFVHKITGESDKIYIDLDSNKTYRWSGLTTFIEISASLALGETSSTAYRGDRGATAYAHATDSGRLTTAASSGLYKISVTGEGHVGSATAVTKSDITALGIPGENTDTKVTVSALSAKSYLLAGTSATGNQSAVASASDYIDASGNLHTAKSIYLDTIGGSINDTTASRFIFKDTSTNAYTYLASNTAGAFSFGFTNASGTNTGQFIFYPNTGSYNCFMPTAKSNLGRNDSNGSYAWGSLYTVGNIYKHNGSNAFYTQTLPSKSGTFAMLSDIPDIPDKPTNDGTYSLNVSDGTSSWTAVAPSGLQPPSSNGHYMLGVNGSSVSWESSPDLYAIEQLSGTSGLLKKTAANTWALDTTTYIASGDIASWAKAANKPSYSLSEISESDDVQAIEGLSGTGLLRRVGSNQWELDSTTYSTLTLGTTSSTACRGDYGNTAYTHASDSSKLTTAQSSGLYKFATTAEGHIASVTAVQKSDITGLGIPAQDTTYTFDGTYNASTNKAATVKTVTDAIGALDGSVTGSAAASKTLTSFSQTNGVVSATFSDISITKSQVSDFPASMPASDVSAWAKASTKPSYALSELTGASDVQAIEALTGTSGLLKKTAADTWSLDTTSYLPTTGGNVTGDITLLKQVSSGAPGDSYALIFQRGTLTDNYNDWMIIDSGGYLYFKERGSGSTAWTTRATFNTTGNISATSFTGSGASLTSLNASNLSSGTVPEARLPDLSSTYIPVSQKGSASGVATLDSNSKLPVVQSNYLYGKCITAGSTAAKTVTIAGYDETTIANMQGVTVFVGFNNPNTATSPTLNVSGSGAHAIVWGSLSDPMDVGNFSSGLHSFTLVKVGSTYYWYINEGRDTISEAPTTTGIYALSATATTASWTSIGTKGAANGFASLDSSGKVPTSQLPVYDGSVS